MDFLIGRRQDLLGLARRFEDEAGAAGAAHAQRIPARQALQPIIILEERDQHLVRGCAVGRASCGGQDRIGLGAIRHHRCILFERHAPAGEPNRAGAGTQVTAAGPLGGRGRQQPLLGAQAPQHPAMPIAAEGMAHQDRHHDLVHREHHAGGGAGAPEHVTDIDDIGDARAFATEFDGNQQAQQPFGARGRERFAGKPRRTIDRIGMRRCCGGRGTGALLEIPWGWKEGGRNTCRHGIRGCRSHRAIPLLLRDWSLSADRLAARRGNGKHSVGYVACNGYQDKYLH